MTWTSGPVEVHIGDALEVLAGMPDASCDALVTDPPGAISFMGQSWDSDRGGRRQWIAWMTEVMRECLRVLKPGAHGLVWAIPRTSHWTATALEDAGFEVRDVVTHLFGSGFPKSLDVSKAIDKAAGAEREVVGPGQRHGGGTNGVYAQDAWTREHHGDVAPLTAPATDAARQWQGWGTALKPASEHWVLVRKPPSEPNVAANVLAHGTGAIHVDACRVATGDNLNGGAYSADASDRWDGTENWRYKRGQAGEYQQPAGRWPTNLVLSHAEGCWPVGTRKVATGTAVQRNRDGEVHNEVYGAYRKPPTADATYADPDGTETVEAWDCVDGCPVAELDRQSGRLTSGFMAAGTQREGIGYHGGLGNTVRNDTIGDSGGASRFFYVAKASTADRNVGLPPSLRNRHSTVKPIELMRWLCRLVTPPGGVVLDCFAGSGTTLVAAKLEGFRAIGIEQDAEWLPVIQGRVAWANHQLSLLEEAP